MGVQEKEKWSVQSKTSGGCNFEEDKCLVLDKAIDELVQAARQFHKRLTKAMEEDMGFDKCLADECLLKKETKKGQ